MVQKKSDLLLQRPPGVDHAVDPVRLPRPVCVGVVQLGVLPPEQSVVDFRKALGVQEIVDKLLVQELVQAHQARRGLRQIRSRRIRCAARSRSVFAIADRVLRASE